MKLTVYPRAYIMMKRVRKPFIVGTNYQRTINTGTLVAYLVSSCENNHYSNVIIRYSFNGQIIHVWCLKKNILKLSTPKFELSPDTRQLGITRSLTNMGQHIRYWCLVQFPLRRPMRMRAHAHTSQSIHCSYTQRMDVDERLWHHWGP